MLFHQNNTTISQKATNQQPFLLFLKIRKQIIDFLSLYLQRNLTKPMAN